jgi:hypothetical protein
MAPISRFGAVLARSSLLVLLSAGAVVVLEPPLYAQSASSPPTGCVTLTVLQQLGLQQSTIPARAQGSRPPTATELRRPISEGEVELLVRALEPVDSKPVGRTPRMFVERGPLSFERVRMLTSDVVSVLAEIHARELLATLGKRRDLSPAGRAQAERMLRGMAGCAEAQFTDRGGRAAFDQTLQIVQKHRPALEKMLLGTLEFKPTSPPVPVGGVR